MDDERKDRIKTLADLTREQVGDSEESVKINFIVPLLEALGHVRLDFEYKYKDIYVRKGLPKFSKLIVETKSYDKKLVQHLDQLERYCQEERPLLGIIANGSEIRIYSYWWKYRATFREHLIYLINRSDLKDERAIQAIENVLSKESLKSGDARKRVNQREEQIEIAESEIRSLEEKAKDDEDNCEAKIRAYEDKISEIQTSISDARQELISVQTQKREQIAEVWSGLGLPKPDVTQHRTTTQTPAPKSVGTAEGSKPKNSQREFIDRMTIKLLKEGPKTPEDIVEAVLKERPDKDYDTLLRTTKRRLRPTPKGYLRKKGVNISKTEDGRYYIEQQD